MRFSAITVSLSAHSHPMSHSLTPILVTEQLINESRTLFGVNKSDRGRGQMHSYQVRLETSVKMSHFGVSSVHCGCVFSLHPHGPVRDQPR